ncbi:hypothetical protein B7Y94_05735 [Candidatus Saccharibacteria bacterium 32-49-12]|nr:MAG: hypothetical protein B7Y94_05735 [Candidatus Saccharibacteria bacterium 32-49-12]
MKYSRNSFSRFVPILLVIVITIVAVAAVIAIGRSILGGGNQPTDPVGVVDDGRTALLTTDISRSVRLTVRGPIVADESFRSYRVTVSPESRVMTTYEGYLEKPLDTKSFGNNVPAYEEFVYALDKRKMMDSRDADEDLETLRGVCADKKLYEFETLVNGETVKRLWTSDCDGAKGTALANVGEIMEMFLKQIPEGRKMANDVGLAQTEAIFRL